RERMKSPGASFMGSSRTELAVMAAVEQVNHEPEDEPNKEAQPSQDGQTCHQQHAEDNAEDGRGDPAGRAEPTTALRLLVAKDNDPDRDQHEREQCADVR